MPSVAAQVINLVPAPTSRIILVDISYCLSKYPRNHCRRGCRTSRISKKHAGIKNTLSGFGERSHVRDYYVIMYINLVTMLFWLVVCESNTHVIK